MFWVLATGHDADAAGEMPRKDYLGWLYFVFFRQFNNKGIFSNGLVTCIPRATLVYNAHLSR